MLRIVFIGAGSVVFTQNIVSDILHLPDLAPVTIVLHDIDAERLATAAAMVRAMVEASGSNVDVEVHADLEASVAGANYVINAIAVGGFDAVQKDFAIPRKYGVRQTIADTLGIGGIFRALRTIPVMVGLGQLMSQACPEALLLNYSNPMTMVPRAVYEGTTFTRVIGVCHSVRDTQKRLASLVGVPLDEVSFVTAGVNHQAFVLRFEHRGQDLYPRLSQAIDADADLGRTVRAEIFRNFGYFPTESSEHGAEYVSWFLKDAKEAEFYRIPVDIYLQWCKDLLDTYDETRRALADGRRIAVRPTSELASEIIHSIETGVRRVVHGNVRNAGLISNLPADACVEVPCLVDGSGVQPIKVGALPPQLAALNQSFLNVSELTVRAALEGRRDHVYQAALVDPNTSSTLGVRAIRAMVDELIAAHGNLMPEGIRV